MKTKEPYIKVSDVLDYCREAAKSHKALAERCIESTGKGESTTSSLGGAAYFLEQARIYEYDIPKIIGSLEHVFLNDGTSIEQDVADPKRITVNNYGTVQNQNSRSIETMNGNINGF